MTHKKEKPPAGRETAGPAEMVSQPRETKLALPAGDPDLEALRSVTREWLVPLLVEKFLREQGIDSRVHPENANSQLIYRNGRSSDATAAGAAEISGFAESVKTTPLPNVSKRKKSTTEG
ncbi:MAG TPA: hypothetical protein VMU53_18170 [Candidatus Sulfotelmatobacter sp.]|nr:hypothetical protein [Candidatus Sulfotelmatobacter sp.]